MPLLFTPPNGTCGSSFTLWSLICIITVDNVKHHLSAFGVVENVQRLIDNGSLIIVDAFYSFFPDFNGMKKLIDLLSQRARKEGMPGVIAIVDMLHYSSIVSCPLMYGCRLQ